MTTAIIWILAAVGIAQAVLATRAYRLEKREGLARSGRRLAASIAIAMALAGLGVVDMLRARAATPAAVVEAPKPAPIVHDAATTAKIAAIKKTIGELETQLATQRAELEKLDPTQATPIAPVVEAPSPPAPWPLLVAVALVLAGFAVLAFGDLTTLLPRRSKKSEPVAPSIDPADPADPKVLKDEPATLPALMAHVHGGGWKSALGIAGRIQIEQLHKLEMLDYLYLKAFASVMAVAAPEGGTAVGHQERTDKLAGATSDLERLLELAPHMAEARWLLGYVKARGGEAQVGLDHMRAARPDLDGLARELDRDESVCLLTLAEQKLAAADNDGATRLFDEVAKIGVLTGQIPIAMVTHRILTVRAQIKAGTFAEAADGIARIRQIEGLDAGARRASTAACDVYDVAIAYRSGKLDKALEATQVFFAAWQPTDLPPVEDQVADEFLLPAIDRAALPLPADLYRGLYFLEAVIRVELASRRGALAPDVVDAIGTALLRALQFQPRHRESLAALAALYLAYRKERSEKALAWLDAAITMGVRSPKAHALLAEARRAEVERKELLAMFRSAAARFLSDPAVNVQVRAALIEELGRFDEFRPVVLDLQDSGALDAPAISDITLHNLRERAAFVGGVAGEILRRGDQVASQQLSDMQRELASLTANVDTSATRIAALERAVMEQLGRIVLR